MLLNSVQLLKTATLINVPSDHDDVEHDYDFYNDH